MTQLTDPRSDNWGEPRNPWATPAQANDASAQGWQADTADVPAPLPPAPLPTAPTAPLFHGFPADGVPPQQPPYPPTPGTTQGRAPRGSRGPGWSGVIAVGLGTAVLASALTGGLVRAYDQTSTTSTSQTAAGSGSTGGNGSSGGSAAPAAPLVPGTGSVPNWVGVAAAVEPSVVSVRVESGSGSGGEGSGVILDNAGRVVTNNHVVAEAGTGGKITVVLSDGRTYPATVVGTDPSTDLAVIKLTQAPTGLKPASFGDSSAAKVGDPVMAVGNPLGLSDTVTTGIVSAVNRPVRTGGSQQQDPFGNGQAQTEQVVTKALQTDAAVNPGNSGGALVNASGRVIGITSSIASLGASSTGQAGSIGLGFAIPSNEVKDVADQLIGNGKVQHAYLGVTLTDGQVSVDGASRQAAVIGSVGDGTPAANAGLRSRDAVIAVNGQLLDGADSLVAQVRAIHPGSKVTLTIVRDGTKQDVQVTLTAKPASTG